MSEDYHTPASNRKRRSTIRVEALYRSRTNKSENQSENNNPLDDELVPDALSNVGERIKSIDVEQQGEAQAMDLLRTLETKQQSLIVKHNEQALKNEEAALEVASQLRKKGFGMLGVAAGGLDKKRVALQDMFQAKLAKTAKSIIKDVQHERKVINSIQKDIGFDIIKESVVPDRAPIEFCYSLPVGKALAAALFSG